MKWTLEAVKYQQPSHTDYGAEYQNNRDIFAQFLVYYNFITSKHFYYSALFIK